MPTSTRRHPNGQPVRGFVALLAAALLATPAGRAEPPPPGTIRLFDGNTLDGWQKTDFANAGEVQVKDGMIVLGTGRAMTGITSTRKDLLRRDYELTYEAMRLGGIDFFAAATFPVGDAYITLVNGGWGGNITGLSSLDGMDASENETSTAIKYVENRWYAFRVHVTGKAIRCWIDGKEIIAVRHEGRQVRTRIEVRRNQPLGFATWESAGAVRAIRMRPLTRDEIAVADQLKDEE